MQFLCRLELLLTEQGPYFIYLDSQFFRLKKLCKPSVSCSDLHAGFAGSREKWWSIQRSHHEVLDWKYKSFELDIERKSLPSFILRSSRFCELGHFNVMQFKSCLRCRQIKLTVGTLTCCSRHLASTD